MNSHFLTALFDVKSSLMTSYAKNKRLPLFIPQNRNAAAAVI